MARFTETYDLNAELDRLDEQRSDLEEQKDELKSEIVAADEPDPETVVEFRSVSGELSDTEEMYAGVYWALNPDEREEREPIEAVTLAALSAGEYAEVGDRVGTLRRDKQKDGWGTDPQMELARRNQFAAACLQDAPGISDGTKLPEKAGIVANEYAPQFTVWLERRGDELTTPSVEGNGSGTPPAATQG